MSKPLPSGMGEKKKFGNLENVVQAGVNVVVVLVATWLGLDVINNAIIQYVVLFLAAIGTLGLQYFVDKYFDEYYRKRDYGKYEGRWLQVIPDWDEYPYTIFDFKYNEDENKYEIEGYNFNRDRDVDGRHFKAYRLVARSKNDGYYYITNRTNTGEIGMGKLYYDGNSGGFTRAYGFFCDVDNTPDARKYETRMIKCDEAFIAKLKDFHPYATITAEDFAKMNHAEAFQMCQQFALEENERYKRMKKKRGITKE